MKSETPQKDLVEEARELLAKRSGAIEYSVKLVMTKLADECERLRGAIRTTLDENGHLADGEVCTLIHLKRAIGEP